LNRRAAAKSGPSYLGPIGKPIRAAAYARQPAKEQRLISQIVLLSMTFGFTKYKPIEANPEPVTIKPFQIKRFSFTRH
jgi:hypothetical protein